MSEIRVLVCHPEQLLRSGIKALLNSEPGVRVVGEAADGFDALSKARGLRPDVALIEERLVGLPGVEVTERLADGVRCIILIEHPDTVFEAVKAGARGFLLHSSGQDELLGAVRATARGEAFFAPQVASRFLQRFESGLRQPATAVADTLTEREREVLGLVAEGMDNAEIAAKLYVSKATVKFHVSNLLVKLGLRDRLQIAVYAHRVGVVGALS
ncbi:MAG: response regulator transcription factor [Thermoactinospora sp.]|nr:response regulator transcription factor [Thermoactinospora sp.]